MTIDWQKAQGKNWALYNTKTNEVIYSDKKPHKTYNGIIDWDSEEAKGCDWAITERIKDACSICFYINKPKLVKPPLSEIHERPKAETQSVYTKQMHDAGELPKVGMMCELNKHKYFYVGVDSTEAHVFQKVGFCDYKSYHLSQMRPIDQRTQAEKDEEETIKAMNNYIESITSNRHAIDEIDTDEQNIAIFNQIKAGKFPLIKYTGECDE